MEPNNPSRAAAAAHRRLTASAARRKPVTEVMLVTSKHFPSQQYQELLNFIKGLQLPPDVTSLFTTVRNERVAERKAALDSQSSEKTGQALQAAGAKLALLAELTDDLGLSATRGMLAVSPELEAWVGKELATEYLSMKERRKALDERRSLATGKPPPGEGKT